MITNRTYLVISIIVTLLIVAEVVLLAGKFIPTVEQVPYLHSSFFNVYKDITVWHNMFEYGPALIPFAFIAGLLMVGTLIFTIGSMIKINRDSMVSTNKYARVLVTLAMFSLIVVIFMYFLARLKA